MGGDSSFYWDYTTTPKLLSITGAVKIQATNELRFYDTDNSNYVGFEAAGTIAADKIWVLPTADGSTDQVLKTDGAGNLGWATVGSATIASGRRISVNNTADQSINAATWTTVSFETEAWDKLGEYNTGTFTFAPSVTGYYDVTALVTLELLPVTKDCYLRVYKNGTTELAVGYGRSTPAATQASIQLAATLYLLSTDSIVVQVYNGDTEARNVSGNPIETYLCINRVEA